MLKGGEGAKPRNKCFRGRGEGAKKKIEYIYAQFFRPLFMVLFGPPKKEHSEPAVLILDPVGGLPLRGIKSP